jgi:hypothetical protein
MAAHRRPASSRSMAMSARTTRSISSSVRPPTWAEVGQALCARAGRSVVREVRLILLACVLIYRDGVGAQGYDASPLSVTDDRLGSGAVGGAQQGIGTETRRPLFPATDRAPRQPSVSKGAWGSSRGPGWPRSRTVPARHRMRTPIGGRSVMRSILLRAIPSVRPAFSIDRATDPLISRNNASPATRHSTHRRQYRCERRSSAVW